MRHPRFLRVDSIATYHCVSRIVDKNFALDEAGKRFFHKWMRRLEEFCGVEVLTYCLMSNHFHLLVRVPRKVSQQPLTEQRLRELLPVLYTGGQLTDAVQELDSAATAATTGSYARQNEILARFDARRFDISLFIKDLKQRFTQWYNGRNERSGTLWESAFHSVLVENGELALLTMAAYIDLNPVRAGLCNHPKDYRYSGYGEAVGRAGRGHSLARRRLCAMLEFTHFGNYREVDWVSAAGRYHSLLLDHGTPREPDPATGGKGRRGIPPVASDDDSPRGTQNELATALRSAIRYFHKGGAFGSEAFVEKVFHENRGCFGPSRASGARKLRGANWGGFRVLRDLRKNSAG